MNKFDPVVQVENNQLILENSEWPNFHDAEVHSLNIWRGDVRPDENIWIGPIIEVVFELCALRVPYIVVLKFHDCDNIRLQDFNHQNALHDLTFEFVPRGKMKDGTPLQPSISVCFKQAFGAALSFTCFRVEVIERKEIRI